MNSNELLSILSTELNARDVQIASLTTQCDAANAALATLQASIDAAQTTVPMPPQPEWSSPTLTGINPSDLSNWSHTGAFVGIGASFEVQRFDGSDWSSVGTGANTGDVCRIRSVNESHQSAWVEFVAA